MAHAPHDKVCACGAIMAAHGAFRVCEHCDGGCTKDGCVRCVAYKAGFIKRLTT